MGVSWIVGLLLLGVSSGPVPVDSSCAEACYQQKSVAYQRCRGIPPSNRAERNRCFREADAALQRCLRACR